MNRRISSLSCLLLAAACGGETNTSDTGALADVPVDVDSGAEADVETDPEVETTEDVTEDPDVAEDVDVAPDLDADPDADAVDPLIDEWEVIPRSETQEGADETLWTPGDDLNAGQAAVGLHPSEYEHFSGPEARCRPNDYVMQNDFIAVCVANALRPSQYTYTGGFVIDMAPADDRDEEMLEMIAPGIDLRNVYADSFEVVRDGSDGGAAVLRVSGDALAFMAVGNFVGAILTGEPLFFETEFRLEPDSASLEVVTWVVGTDPDLVRTRIEPGDMMLGGDHVTHWSPMFGQIAARPLTESDLWVGVANSFSYGVWSEGMRIGVFAPGVIDSDLDPTVMTRGVIGPATEANYVRRYAVGRDTRALRQNLAPYHAANEGETVTLTGRVSAGYEERRFAIRGPDGEFEVVRLNDDGEADVTLPAGDYTAHGWDTDTEDWTTAFTVPSTESIELNYPEFGTLDIWVDETQGESLVPSSALVEISGDETSRRHIVRGAGEFLMRPGTYDLLISRGEEFSTSEHVGIVVAAGADTEVVAAIERVMDTENWISGDFHQHQRRSIDSTVENTVRVESNLAHGLDFIAPSDHDAVENFPRIIREMGVDDLIVTYGGSEVSPVWGHTNMFPLVYSPELPGFGSVALSSVVDGEIIGITGPEIAEQARGLGADVIQVNHPREGLGFLNASEYDPVLGPEFTDDEFFFADFDSIEVVNSPSDTCEVMRDWFSFLLHGMHVAGIGNSDSHSLGDLVGWPRNYVLAEGITGASQITEEIISDAVVGMNVSVSGGIFLDFGEGLYPGETVELAEPGAYSFNLRAQTPAWVRAQFVIVYVNGVEVDRFEIDSAVEDILDFQSDVEVEIADDAFVVFFAYTPGTHPIVTAGERIFGFTNPVFVDVGGDGWVAPGVADEAALPTPTGIPFCRAEKEAVPDEEHDCGYHFE